MSPGLQYTGTTMNKGGIAAGPYTVVYVVLREPASEHEQFLIRFLMVYGAMAPIIGRSVLKPS